MMRMNQQSFLLGNFLLKISGPLDGQRTLLCLSVHALRGHLISEQIGPLDHADRKPWVYFLAATGGFCYTALGRTVIAKLLHTLWPGKDVFSAGILEVDIRPVRDGQNFVVKWRSKPVFVRKRTPEMIQAARKDDVLAASMRDPATDAQICKKPEWLIVIGVCTHLGCIPQPDAGNFGGYFCPCHGSHYDNAGRIRQGPASKNLEVPPVTFLDEGTVKLG